MQSCRPVSVHSGTSFICDSVIVTTYVIPEADSKRVFFPVNWHMNFARHEMAYLKI